MQLVFPFGSAADPEAREVLDIDLGVLTRPPLDLHQRLALQADLRAAVQAPIDLVPLEGASIVLAREVAATGRCLYARDPELEAEFVVGAHRRYLDFKPFLDTQQRLLRERLEAKLDGLQG